MSDKRPTSGRTHDQRPRAHCSSRGRAWVTGRRWDARCTWRDAPRLSLSLSSTHILRHDHVCATKISRQIPTPDLLQTPPESKDAAETSLRMVCQCKSSGPLASASASTGAHSPDVMDAPTCVSPLDSPFETSSFPMATFTKRTHRKENRSPSDGGRLGRWHCRSTHRRDAGLRNPENLCDVHAVTGPNGERDANAIPQELPTTSKPC